MKEATKAFLGTGWAFPVRVSANGKLATVSAEEDIQESIRLILGTNPGERIMRPEFGAGLDAFVFEPINTGTLARLKKQVEDALVMWEPRIQITEVRVTPDANENGRILIGLEYRVWATNSRHNLVYPFYLDEGGAR